MYATIARSIELVAKKMVGSLRAGDWKTVSEIVETNVALNHALGSTGPHRMLIWNPATLAVMDLVKKIRDQTKTRIFYAVNSGPSIFVYVHNEDARRVKRKLSRLGLPLFESSISAGAFATSRHLF